MSDLSYLQDAAWITDREKKWKKLFGRWIDGASEKEIAARREYFFEGDIDVYINGVQRPGLYDVISDSPFVDVDLVLECIAKYWAWVLDKPNSRDRSEQFPNVEQRFQFHFHAVYSRKDDNLHPNVCIGLFRWLYGKSYENSRVVELCHDGNNISIPVLIDVDNLCLNLLNGIIEYLWRQDVGENTCIFKSLIPYFLSIYPHMSPMCFETKLPETDEFESNGKKYYRKYWLWNRWLLSTLSGFISEYEEDEEDEEIEELVCNDEDALAQLKDGLEGIQMPEGFYRLKEFVLKHEGDSLYASE